MTASRLLISALLLPGALWAADPAVPEYAMKTAYLYNFAQLTEFPASSSTGNSPNFTVCAHGTEGWGDALNMLIGKKVSGRPIRLLTLREPAEARQCDLLLISEGNPLRSTRVINSVRNLPILTVTDRPGIEAMLTIFNEERRLAFEVNLESTKASQLGLSSKLLSLARRVVKP